MTEHRNEALQSRLLLFTVFIAFAGQMMLNPVIAPLSRAMHMAEWHIGATISLAAIALAACSQFWGRRSQHVGAKSVLLMSMTIAAGSLAGFAVISWLGVRGVLVGSALVVAVMVTRGLAYGGAIAAVYPTAQAYLIARSPTESERVKAVGALGAVQGLSAIVGAILGGGLAALGGLLLPITVMPLAVLGGVIVLALKFRPQAPTFLVEQPRSISYWNPKVLPFLITGFALFLSFASLQTVLGFAVQDRFGLDATSTAAMSAVLMLIMSVTMALTQAVGVRLLGWDANSLLRVGLPLAAVGCLLLVPHTWTTLVFSCLFVGVGVGMAIPGYTAGPTLYLESEEQGSLAGLINANNGITYAIAPPPSSRPACMAFTPTFRFS